MITNVLILLSTAFSLYAWFTQNDLAFSAYAFAHREYYTLLTGLFVHADPVHLIGNMLFLYVFGSSLEDEIGDERTGAVFFSGGVFSFILSIPIYPDAQMVGTSAAIFSIMSALLLVRRPEFSIRFLLPTGPLIIVFMLFNIFAMQRGETGNVAYISHSIGFLIGLFFGASWNRRWKESLLYTLFLLAIYIFVYNFLKAQWG